MGNIRKRMEADRADKLRRALVDVVVYISADLKAKDTMTAQERSSIQTSRYDGRQLCLCMHALGTAVLRTSRWTAANVVVPVGEQLQLQWFITFQECIAFFEQK